MPKSRNSRGQQSKDVNDLSIEEIDQLIAETKQSDKEKIGTSADSSSAILVFLITALVTAALPIYLFTSPMFNLDLAQNATYFGVATVVAAACLTVSYSTAAKSEQLRLSKAREGSTVVEASAWALFYINALYLSLFMLFAFYLIPKIDGVPAFVTYTVSTAVPAVVLAAFQSGIF